MQQPRDPLEIEPEALVPQETRVEGFRQAREARRSALVEDYVELIADLIDDGGEARQVDIAARLGVAQPTVAKMLKRLAEEGLVAQKPYRGAFLTLERAGAGAAQPRTSPPRRALSAGARHRRRDGAPRCRRAREHHVSGETLDAFARVLARQR